MESLSKIRRSLLHTTNLDSPQPGFSSSHRTVGSTPDFSPSERLCAHLLRFEPIVCSLSMRRALLAADSLFARARCQLPKRRQHSSALHTTLANTDRLCLSHLLIKLARLSARPPAHRLIGEGRSSAGVNESELVDAKGTEFRRRRLFRGRLVPPVLVRDPSWQSRWADECACLPIEMLQDH